MRGVGGSAVAESLGGRLLEPGSADPHERKLLNIVEEMSIASGVPMPKVYVMDEENDINAFAAGHAPSDAAVSVTRGSTTMTLSASPLAARASSMRLYRIGWAKAVFDPAISRRSA